MRVTIVADHDARTAVTLHPTNPGITWRPKVNVRLVQVVYRPGLGGTVIHVSTYTSKGGK